MKEVDVAKPVMEKVVAYEKARTRHWVLRFVIIVGILTIFVAAALGMAAVDVAQKQSLELLTLFAQEPEIIAEFWQDTLSVFWQELPQQTIFLALILTGGIIGIFLVTKMKRGVIRTKLSALAKYEKTRHNIHNRKKER